MNAFEAARTVSVMDMRPDEERERAKRERAERLREAVGVFAARYGTAGGKATVIGY